jgi:hypothetical protein
MLYVDMRDVADNTDGTVSATLVCDGVAVRCEGIAWLDEMDNDERMAVFEEWHELAQAGEEGYVIL